MTSARTAACLGLGFSSALLLCLYYSAQQRDIRPGATSDLPSASTTVLNSETFDPEPLQTYAGRDITPSKDNVLFIETSCALRTPENSVSGGLRLNSRQACAVFSTAHHNPSRPVHIFHTCPVSKDFYYRSSAYVQKLLELPNVSVVEIKVPELLTGSPLEPLLDGRLNSSSYPVEHSSDILRLLLLWRYGGTYMDLDVVSLRPLDALGSDFIGAEDPTHIANGIMNFEPTGPGHEFLQNVMNVLRNEYNPSAWSANGPLLVTRVLQKFCNINHQVISWGLIGQMKCGIRVFPEQIFYPIPYQDWKKYFDEKNWTKMNKSLEGTYVVHVWNKLSKAKRVDVGSDQPYGVIAKYNCPNVYFNCGPYF